MNNNRFGLDPKLFWVLDYCFNTKLILYAFITLPINVLSTKLCPLDFAATTYALFSTIVNISEIIGLSFGGLLGQSVGLDAINGGPMTAFGFSKVYTFIILA